MKFVKLFLLIALCFVSIQIAYTKVDKYKFFQLISITGQSLSFNKENELFIDNNINVYEHGQLRFKLISDSKAVLKNIKTNKEVICDVVKRQNSIFIIEDNESNIQNCLIIYNDWYKEKKGYKCIYIKYDNNIQKTITSYIGVSRT
jgi:hypothetical protein